MATVVTYSSPGVYTWTCPPNVYEVLIECWGAGGGGAGSSNVSVACGGGGGGEYAADTIPVSPGTNYTIIVGYGGNGGHSTGGYVAGSSGEESFFSDEAEDTLYVVAYAGQGASAPGQGGEGGTGSGNGTNFDGGYGGGAGPGPGHGDYPGGGGGGGAGNEESGGEGGYGPDVSGGSTPGGSGGFGGSAGGGDGGDGAGAPGNDGSSGNEPGGGGGGSSTREVGGNTGGSGASGQVQLTYTVAFTATMTAGSSMTAAGHVNGAATLTSSSSLTAAGRTFSAATMTAASSMTATSSIEEEYAAFQATSSLTAGGVTESSATMTAESELIGITIVPQGGMLFYAGVCAPVVHPIDDTHFSSSAVIQTSWNISGRIDAQQSVSWDITGYGIKATREISWDSYYRVHVIGIPLFGNAPSIPDFAAEGLHFPLNRPVDWSYESTIPQIGFPETLWYSFGILGPILHPIPWLGDEPFIEWDQDRRISASAEIEWRIIRRETKNKHIAWRIRTQDYASRETAWRIRERIQIPGPARRFFTGIDQETVHPISAAPQIPVPSIAWDMDQFIQKKQHITWNCRNKVTASVAISWHDGDNSVSADVASSWGVKKRLSSRASSQWHLVSRTYRRQVMSWRTNAIATSPQKEILWNTLQQVKVERAEDAIDAGLPVRTVHPISFALGALQFAWNIDQRLTPSAEIKWRNDVRKHASVSVGWKTLMRVYVNDGFGYKTGICQIVVHPVDDKNYVPVPQIEWGYSSPVTSTQEVTWNIYDPVTAEVIIEWASVQRTSSSVQIEYRVLNPVQSDVIIEWNVGKPLQQQIRQTSSSRLDFTY